MKTELCKIESDLHISRNVNDKLSDKLLVLEWKCQAYEQCSRRECLKILGILAEVGDKDIEVLEILDTVNTPINMNLVKDCHCIPSKRLPQKSCSKTKPLERLDGYCWTKKVQLKPEFLKLPAVIKIYIHQWEIMSILQKIMDKMQKIVGCQVNFVILD